MPVHPRVCGEHPTEFTAGTSTIGSSPRVRGTLQASLGLSMNRRFIPACAGNTRTLIDSTRPQSVHPRVCGEHPVEILVAPLCDGSSPRVRGTPSPGRSHRSGSRFIPACAGNTIPGVDDTSNEAVHPRVCGEHRSRRSRVWSRNGSSPRVRGTRTTLDRELDRIRFIPACAGNTACNHPDLPGAPVHPRVCGEHLGLMSRSLLTVGSSPRVRGTQMWVDTTGSHNRFIPACAGNTYNPRP